MWVTGSDTLTLHTKKYNFSVMWHAIAISADMRFQLAVIVLDSDDCQWQMINYNWEKKCFAKQITKCQFNSYDLVMPYGEVYLGQHWFR